MSSGVSGKSIRYKSISSEVYAQTDDRLVPDDIWAIFLCNSELLRALSRFCINHTVNVNRSGTGLKGIGSAYKHICHWRVLQESRFHHLTNIYWSLTSCETKLDDSSGNERKKLMNVKEKLGSTWFQELWRVRQSKKSMTRWSHV